MVSVWRSCEGQAKVPTAEATAPSLGDASSRGNDASAEAARPVEANRIQTMSAGDAVKGFSSDRHRASRPAAESAMRPARVRGGWVAAMAAAIMAFVNGTAAKPSESVTKRINGGVIVSAPLAHGLWLHTEVKRVKLFCSSVTTMSGREGRHTSHEFQAFVTTGGSPDARRSSVERLRLTSLIGDDPGKVTDCHGAEWCHATYEDGCRRSCAHAEAWQLGAHVATGTACVERR